MSVFDEDREPQEEPEPDPIISHIQQVFSTPQGEALLAWLREKCFFVRPAFRPGDPYLSAYNEGKRGVYLDLISHLEYDDLTFINDIANRRSKES